MTSDRMQPNAFINRVRREVAIWRKGGYVGVTPVTRRLLEHWTNVERERRLFFCQVEAAETAIFLGEVASKAGVTWIDNELKAINAAHNGGLFRVGLRIPYSDSGRQADYIPDFVVRVRATLESEPSTLLIEVTGERRPDVRYGGGQVRPSVLDAGEFRRGEEIVEPLA